MKQVVWIFVLGFFMAAPNLSWGQYELDQKEVLKKINQLRAKGCKCGRKKMKPVHPLVWNETLEKSAYLHAKDMSQKKYFSHFSKNGKDVGDRVDKLGYNWQFIGENIAEGQKSFSEAMVDWIKSKTHCEMLMNPDMTEIGVARYK